MYAGTKYKTTCYFCKNMELLEFHTKLKTSCQKNSESELVKYCGNRGVCLMCKEGIVNTYYVLHIETSLIPVTYCYICVTKVEVYVFVLCSICKNNIDHNIILISQWLYIWFRQSLKNIATIDIPYLVYLYLSTIV